MYYEQFVGIIKPSHVVVNYIGIRQSECLLLPLILTVVIDVMVNFMGNSKDKVANIMHVKVRFMEIPIPFQPIIVTKC